MKGASNVRTMKMKGTAAQTQFILKHKKVHLKLKIMIKFCTRKMRTSMNSPRLEHGWDDFNSRPIIRQGRTHLRGQNNGIIQMQFHESCSNMTLYYRDHHVMFIIDIKDNKFTL